MKLYFDPIIYIIFVSVHRRRSRKMQSLNSPQKSPLPIGGLPVNCCGPAGSPGPLGSIATLSAFNHHKVNKKWFSILISFIVSITIDLQTLYCGNTFNVGFL